MKKDKRVSKGFQKELMIRNFVFIFAFKPIRKTIKVEKSTVDKDKV